MWMEVDGEVAMKMAGAADTWKRKWRETNTWIRIAEFSSRHFATPFCSPNLSSRHFLGLGIGHWTQKSMLTMAAGGTALSRSTSRSILRRESC
jgi:hypothetical protein